MAHLDIIKEVKPRTREVVENYCFEQLAETKRKNQRLEADLDILKRMYDYFINGRYYKIGKSMQNTFKGFKNIFSKS